MNKAIIALAIIGIIAAVASAMIDQEIDESNGIQSSNICEQTHKPTNVGNTDQASCESTGGYTLNQTHCCTPNKN